MLDATCPPEPPVWAPTPTAGNPPAAALETGPPPLDGGGASCVIPSARLMCVIEGARDPALLLRVAGELARRGRVPDTLVSGPAPGRPDTQSVTVAVTLSSAREAAHLVRRFATWPCVTRVRALSPIEAGGGCP